MDWKKTLRIKKYSKHRWAVVFQNEVEIGEIYQEVDGEFVFIPYLRGGFWQAFMTQAITDMLNDLNKQKDLVQTEG
jgi:hypothetical protein